ncbi:MAG: histidinol-phosphatase HisJ family protein [Christensenellaceae bacterium]
MITDVHTHSKFSCDGVDTLEDMVLAAEALGVDYYGVAEHFDYDYLVDGVTLPDQETLIYIDTDAYFTAARTLQKSAKLRLLVGAEFGFTDREELFPMYEEVLSRYQPDFVVNSVHTTGKYDYYDRRSFAGKSVPEVFRAYLARVRKSLDAPYRYDIVAHLGYPSRFVEGYPLSYEAYRSEIDDILSAIIRKGKILEVNSSSKRLKTPFLPERSILEAYYRLGGRKISFASDAHGKERIAQKRELVVSVLKEIGFSHLTVPCQGEEILIEL